LLQQEVRHFHRRCWLGLERKHEEGQSFHLFLLLLLLLLGASASLSPAKRKGASSPRGTRAQGGRCAAGPCGGQTSLVVVVTLAVLVKG